MSDSLTTLVSRIQLMLLDDGTQFSTATCTAAVREALRWFNTAAPIVAGTLIDTVADQYEYALNDSAFAGLLDVLSVHHNPSGVEGSDTIQDYDQYYLDNEPFIRLRLPLGDGTATLDVKFTLPHTVNGLDSETMSTLNAAQDQVLVDGACAAACFIRAADRIEGVNLDNSAPANWKATGDRYMTVFRQGLIRYQRRPMPAQTPDSRAWNDRWTNWSR